MTRLATAVHTQASAYDLYDLLSLCADQRPSSSTSGPSSSAPAVDTEAMAVCARILAAVAPGSSALCEVGWLEGLA